MKSSQMLILTLLLLMPLGAIAQEEEVIVEEEWQLDQDPDWIPGRGSLIFKLGGFVTESKKQVREDADYYEYQPYGYNNFGVGVEYNFALNKFISITGGADIFYKKVKTEFWADTDAGDKVKRQNFEFSLIPITASVKLFPFGNGMDGNRDRTILPWIGGGIGAYIISEGDYEEYEYYDEYWDDWVDDYTDTYTDVGFGSHIAGGIQYNFSERFSAGFEVRYTWAEATPYEDYYGNDPLDIGGMNIFFTFGYGL